MQSNTLRKKLADATHAPKEMLSSMSRHLITSFQKAAHEHCGLPLIGAKGKAVEIDLPDLSNMLAEQRLFGVLEGRQMPAGFVALNGALLSAIVEYQTLGRLIDRDQKNRRVTMTEAALVAPLIDSTIQKTAASYDLSANGLSLGAYHFAKTALDQQELFTMLDSQRFVFFKMYFNFEGLKSSGELYFGFDEKLLLPTSENLSQCGLSTLQKEQILKLNTQLSAILFRFSMPLLDVSKLKPGKEVIFPKEALQTIELISTAGGPAIPAVLGKSGANRAVKVMLNSTSSKPVTNNTTAEETTSIPNEMPENGLEDLGPPNSEAEKGSEQTNLPEPSEIAKTVTEIVEQTEEKTVLQQDKGEVVELNLKSAS